jgi:hypothetical protein
VLCVVNGKVFLTWEDEGVENLIAADRSTFQVEPTGWSKDLAVEVGGHGVVSHAGSAAVRLLADRTGKRKIKIPETWAWAHELHACFLTIFALPPPP